MRHPKAVIFLMLYAFALASPQGARADNGTCLLDRIKGLLSPGSKTLAIAKKNLEQQEALFGALTPQEEQAALKEEQTQLDKFVQTEQRQGASPVEIQREIESFSQDQKDTVEISAATPEELATKIAPFETGAIDALKSVQLTGEEAQGAVKSWFSEVQAQQSSGRPLSVMEHTTLVHILRSGFLDQLPEASARGELDQQMRGALEKSYRELTGKALDSEKILDTPLPKSVLKNASYRERQFHLAAFRSPRGAVSSKGTSTTGASSTQQAAIAAMMLGIGFSHAGGIPHGEALAGALTGYAVASAGMEWFTHRFILHMRPEESQYIKKLGKGGLNVMKNFRFHTANHHGMFPEKKYTTTINEEWQSGVPIGDSGQIEIAGRDKVSKKAGDDPKELHENLYGMSMNKREIRVTSIMGMGMAAILSHIFGFGPEGYAAALAISPASSFMTPMFHRFLHMIESVRYQQAPAFKRALMTTQYWRNVSRRHYMHHVDTKSNYSLFLPGPDFWFRHVREPDIGDLLRMEDKGVLY